MPVTPTAAAMSIALYLGLNGALQRRVDLESLAVGSVNRAKASSAGIGGKGQGAYIAALQLAEADAVAGVGAGLPTPKLCMFLGKGREGDMLGEFLSRRAGLGQGDSSDPSDLTSLWVPVDSPCRICTTIVESSSGDATEIVEPTGPVQVSEWDALLARLDAIHDVDGAAAVGVLGSMPPGVPTDGYAQILRKVCGPRTKVLIDSVVNVQGTLRAAAESVRSCDGRGGGTILKLNAREILKLVGQDLSGSDSQVAADPVAVADACLEIARSLGAASGCTVDYICFTDGPFPGGVMAIRSGRRWCLERTRSLRGPVVSPIGAGDSTSAGTLHAWCRSSVHAEDADAAAVEAFRFGLAVGAASCLTGDNAVFDMADVRDIFDSIVATEQ
ncbi:unnamed protein product [Polarella glacialis]|uniref:Carbohydrate kinase PfkB domain-containing protein n=1 Tax=Polarella glacialis TaxID=89957 RepID=A0A813H8Q0_POLGL|nr:unnamed protein product [Polarella glacialis]